MPRKASIYIALAFVLLIFATIQSGAKNVDIDLVIREINMSPEIYHAQYPEVFPVKSEGEYSDDPKWKMRYKYVFIPQENPDALELNGNDYAQGHPKDIMCSDDSQKNRFLIFSNSLPDERIFTWHIIK